ncbi:MAG: hypothetical protein WA137_01970 [Methanothrix sp.]
MKILVLLIFLIPLISIAAIGQVPSTIYFTDARESPGKVYSSAMSGSENIYFARPSGNIYTFAFHPYVPEKLYYVNANDNKIYLATRTSGGVWTSTDQVVYTHSTYVRDLEYYPTASGGLEVYFSESSGAGGDGQIYLLSGGAATPYYTVRLSDVDGFWAGDFIHGSDGNLYLSSGNQIPAYIYRVSGSTVSKIYTSDAAPITGMAYRDGSIYYANWGNEIHRLDLSTLVDTVVRSQPGHTWTSDVGLASFSAVTEVLTDASGITNPGIATNVVGKTTQGLPKKTINQLNPQPEPPKPKYY